MTDKVLSEHEARLVRMVDQAIAIAEMTDGVIDETTARRIAARLHLGARTELGRFAGTGRLGHYQAARLELHYLVKDQPVCQRWAAALRGYITAAQRQARVHQAKTVSKRGRKTVLRAGRGVGR